MYGLQTTCVRVGSLWTGGRLRLQLYAALVYAVLEYQLYVYQGSSMVATVRRGGGSKPTVREAIATVDSRLWNCRKRRWFLH